ncbi:cuticular protein RR-1 motif 15 precursor [Danaus plexippus plexippus]|uniref:Cuticular protein RR-1 motif 15 n=1 Tax=Danaus plexippus plexippus TaxID=278856 RepID=A0A212FLY8_DANPL|nr:cuticular protein RR-1 motif 15 precursor [Danaus plexippus plexippus]
MLGVCSAARLDNAYLPPRGGDGAGYGATGSGFGSSFGRGAVAGFGPSGAGFGGNAGGQSYSGAGSNPADANAQILKYNNEVTAEGFSYDFETSNGIRADASGVATNGVQSQGSFSYKGDDGQDYSITYTADENGYQPRGAHLPTPPPIPEAILKSLEQNARDEAAGIVDDGSYRGEGAGSAAGYSGQGAYSGNRGYNSQAGNFGGSSGFGGSSNIGAASRQYLAPNVGARGSGNGNYNSQTGYRY